MKRPIRILLAVIVIIIITFLWFGLMGGVLGWKHGGGAIPMMLFFGLVVFVWRAITKKTPEEIGENSKTAVQNNEFQKDNEELN
jgi:Sec-independent protein secretion pathway component TatC